MLLETGHSRLQCSWLDFTPINQGSLIGPREAFGRAPRRTGLLDSCGQPMTGNLFGQEKPNRIQHAGHDPGLFVMLQHLLISLHPPFGPCYSLPWHPLKMREKDTSLPDIASKSAQG